MDSHRSQLLLIPYVKLREEQLQQITATRPLLISQDLVKALLTTDVTRWKTEEKGMKPGCGAAAHQ